MPIRWRLTIFNALAIGAILVLLGFALHFLMREALLSGLEDTVQNRAEAAAMDLEDREDLEELASGEDAEELTLDGVFVVVRDEEGNVLAQTADLVGGPAAEDTIWRQAARSGEPASGTASLSGQAPELVHAVPTRTEEGSTLIIEAGKSYEAVNASLAAFRTALLIGLGVAMLLSVIGAYLLARAALSPVENVVTAARGISDEDLSRRLPVSHSRDEIGRLATTINGLLARLEAAFARREEALTRQRSFVADASHELRTPLTSIGGYARMLEEWGLEDPAAAREGVAAIRRESERMGGLVEQLLALARGDEGPPPRPEPTDLAAVAGDAVHDARASADGKVSIEYVAPEDPVSATVDHNRIREAVSILLDNAVRYTPEAGKVTIRPFQRDGLAGLEVEDTGAGIPEEHLHLIFERFHRVDEARGDAGAGLGLSIARQVAEAHGGRIEVDSTLGEGSTFTLLLPGERGQSELPEERGLGRRGRPIPERSEN